MRRLRHRGGSDFPPSVTEPGNGLKVVCLQRPDPCHCPLLPASVPYSPVEIAIEGQVGEEEASREGRKLIIREVSTDRPLLEAAFWGVGPCYRVSR